MEPICEECNGKEPYTKICLKCNAVFCDRVMTPVMVEKSPGNKIIKSCCPHCGAGTIINIHHSH